MGIVMIMLMILIMLLLLRLLMMMMTTMPEWKIPTQKTTARFDHNCFSNGCTQSLPQIIESCLWLFFYLLHNFFTQFKRLHANNRIMFQFFFFCSIFFCEKFHFLKKKTSFETEKLATHNSLQLFLNLFHTCSDFHIEAAALNWNHFQSIAE